MNDYWIDKFLDERCEFMPEGNEPIYEMGEPNAEGFVDEVLICHGPKNWMTYQVDTHLLFLEFLGWKHKPPTVKHELNEFCDYIASKGIRMIWKGNYSHDGLKPPKEFNKPYLGKVFLGIRYLKEGARVDWDEWPEKGSKATNVFDEADWLENLEYRASGKRSPKMQKIYEEALERGKTEGNSNDAR